MKTVTVAELREHLDEYLDLVWAGESLEIRDEKGRVALLVPKVVAKTSSEPVGFDVESLIAPGKLRRGGSGKLPDDFFTRPRPKFESSVLEALLEEREEGW